MTDQLNPTSRDWKIVEAWAEKELADARRLLESPLTTGKKTQRLRGAVAQLKALLALASPPTPQKPPDAEDPLGQIISPRWD